MVSTRRRIVKVSSSVMKGLNQRFSPERIYSPQSATLRKALLHLTIAPQWSSNTSEDQSALSSELARRFWEQLLEVDLISNDDGMLQEPSIVVLREVFAKVCSTTLFSRQGGARD